MDATTPARTPPPAHPHDGPHVVVLGAGPAGIATAFLLQQAGVPYLVLDRAPVVASTWASLYPSLRLNTSKWFSHLPGAPMPRHWHVFPTGRQYTAYVQHYAAQHALNIRLGVTVRRVAHTPDPRGGPALWWRVETDHGVYDVPCVVSATGRFGAPRTPALPGLADFTGTALHAQRYHGPEPFAGRRVLVVGTGPSGVDIAPDVARAAQHPVLLSVRTGVVLRPRYPLGLPKHAWTILAERLPRALGTRLERFVETLSFGDLARHGIRVPAPGQASSAAATRGRELVDAVRRGRVVTVAGLARVEGPRGVVFDDGTRATVDAIIFATGYDPVLYTHLDAPVAGHDGQGWPLRDVAAWPAYDPAGDPSTSGREVLGLPGLYLVGVFYKGKGTMYNIRTEATIAVAQAQQRLASLGLTTSHVPALAGGVTA